MNDRPIEELLQLDTYQGMTDSEIDTLLDYRVEQRMREAEYQMKVDAVTSEMETAAQVWDDYHAHSVATFDAIIANGIDLQVISYE